MAKARGPRAQPSTARAVVPSGESERARVCVAQIGAAHGTRGEVRLWTFTDDPMAVARYGPLESEDGARVFRIAAARPAKRCLIARLTGVEDRAAAERLTNLRLYVPRSKLPATEDAETYYHADLIGLAVVGPDGVELGRVTAVQNFGAGDLLEVAPAAGGPTIMIPFTRAVVPAVDMTARRLVVDPPDGLFADAGSAARKDG